MNRQTMKMGNAPNVPINEILNLRGKVCAVEFETRELLASGNSKDEVLKKLETLRRSDRKFYWYVVPRSFRNEQDITNMASEIYPT